MSRLNSVLNITQSLERLLNEKVTTKNRDQIITQINDLIEKRGDLLQQVKAPFSEEEQQVGKEIVRLNDKIQKQMQVIFTELKQEMQQVNKQKKSTKTYENPYESVHSMDGMFLDQKK